LVNYFKNCNIHYNMIKLEKFDKKDYDRLINWV